MENMRANIRRMFDGPATSELDPAERRARLKLARSARIGPVTFHEALQHFGSARAAGTLATTTDAAVVQEEQALAKAGGSFLVIGHVAYQLALAALPEDTPQL